MASSSWDWNLQNEKNDGGNSWFDGWRSSGWQSEGWRCSSKSDEQKWSEDWQPYERQESGWNEHAAEHADDLTSDPQKNDNVDEDMMETVAVESTVEERPLIVKVLASDTAQVPSTSTTDFQAICCHS